MALNGNSFAAKLHELEDEYRLLRLRIQQAQRLDSAQLRQALTSVLADCRKTSQSLARSVKEGRSPAVAALSGVQLDYMKRMEELLQKELPEDLHGKNHTEAIDHAEAAALYAEYAMDFANLSMRQALAAALAALLQAAENQETNEKGATQYE